MWTLQDTPRQFRKECIIKLFDLSESQTPANLGFVKVFQETQAIFLKFGLTSHQNLVRMDWICLHREMGILKHDMAYEGIAARIALRRTCFPAPLRNFVAQLCDL